MRRLRTSPAMRSLVRETNLSPANLILPLFVHEGDTSVPIEAMPGVSRLTLCDMQRTVERAAAAGLGGVMLFGVPSVKDETGSEAWNPCGIAARSIEAARQTAGDTLVVAADVCLCEYTSHGHCGVVESGAISNDATVKLLAQTAVCYANAGVDIVAPSDMMDGRVAEIRKALDRETFVNTAIMAYSAKTASAFYGPFREAAGSTPAFGDRRTYQMDAANGREAMREMQVDADEGADILMVKPGLLCLDILGEARRRFDHPLAVYNVSGEYSMLKAAVRAGWLDESRAVEELLVAFRRAGADIILTYHALEYAERVRNIH
ncbi:MAG: porphobilinogen synthase [Armatimonadetes bacterium]|nr:porphobilinogen synthase [Armatimonadota bacterium]MDE2207023.1 porphobilinogen synthase [Armatimonadota bacterium]